MKIKHPLFLLLLTSMLLSNCKKNNDDMQILDPKGDIFSCNIDGRFYSSDNVTGIDVGFLQIGATLGSAVETFQLVITNTDPGTYSISAISGAEVTMAYYVSAIDPMTLAYVGTSGTLTIEEHDTTAKRIKGTFSFVGEQAQNQSITNSFTNGKFDVKYQ